MSELCDLLAELGFHKNSRVEILREVTNSDGYYELDLSTIPIKQQKLLREYDLTGGHKQIPYVDPGSLYIDEDCGSAMIGALKFDRVNIYVRGRFIRGRAGALMLPKNLTLDILREYVCAVANYYHNYVTASKMCELDKEYAKLKKKYKKEKAKYRAITAQSLVE